MSDSSGKDAEEKPHYLGHRHRLREKLLKNGADSLADYELLELLLALAIPRIDVKPLAKTLIKEFGSFAGAVAADPAALGRIKGMGEGAIAGLTGDPTPSKDDVAMTKAVAAAAEKLGILLHDHVVVGRKGHKSMRSLGLLG